MILEVSTSTNFKELNIKCCVNSLLTIIRISYYFELQPNLVDHVKFIY